MYRLLLHLANLLGGYGMGVAASSALSGIVGFPFAIFLSLAVDLPVFPIVIYAALSTALTWFAHSLTFNIFRLPLNASITELNHCLQINSGALALKPQNPEMYAKCRSIAYRLPGYNAKIAFAMVFFIVAFSTAMAAISQKYSPVHFLHLGVMCLILIVLHTSFTYVFTEIFIRPLLALLNEATAAEKLKQGSHAIIHSGSFDREFIAVVEGLNSATSTIFEYQTELENKVEIRTKDLNEEKQKSDRLLRNILPDEVIHELKSAGQVKPKHYDAVSVMFTDFVGFTKIAETLSPNELIAELDHCFSYFDQVIRRHNLEKLKTIGDAYMCMGGAPIVNKTHAVDCALAALEIQAFMNQMKKDKEKLGLPYWELRLGLHTGPIVAGVIGEAKFAYDIWGDTVNTASRMESSGTAGKINISETTHRLLQKYFDCEFRGSIPAKNKGDIAMYYLTGLKGEFANDTAGLIRIVSAANS